MAELLKYYKTPGVVSCSRPCYMLKLRNITGYLYKMARENPGANPVNEQFEPEKKNIKEIRLLWSFLSPYRWTVLFALIALVITAGSTPRHTAGGPSHCRYGLFQ